MELLLTAIEEGTDLLLTTPFVVPIVVGLFAAGCWVLAVVFDKAQEVA